VEKLDAVADRGYFNGEEILACEEAGIAVTLPKPMTSNSKAEGRFGKQDFRYVAEEDVYVCPAGERLAYYYTSEEKGLVVHRYATKACRHCAIKHHNCTKGAFGRGRGGEGASRAVGSRAAAGDVRCWVLSAEHAAGRSATGASTEGEDQQTSLKRRPAEINAKMQNILTRK
jgi:hypothetical protein